MKTKKSSVLLIAVILSIISFSTCQEKNKEPICKIINPTDKDTIQQGDILTITAEADDEDGNIVEVRFYVDDIGIGSSDIFPYKYDWDTKDQDVGIHKIKVEAKDDNGASGSDNISIFIIGPPTKANAGEDQIFTDGKTTSTVLSANTPDTWQGKGKWRIISGKEGSFENDTMPNTIFTGKICNAYILRWVIKTINDSTYDDVNIKFLHIPTTAKAGKDQSFKNEITSLNLDGNIPEKGFGNGKWTIINGEGGSFENDTIPNTLFYGKNCTSYVLRWSICTECNCSFDEVKISFNQTPTKANAGEDQTFTDGTTKTTLLANEPVIGHGKGKWTIVNGEGGSFKNDTLANTTFYGKACASYTLRWTISTECTNSSDEVIIAFSQTPTKAYAGEDQIFTDGTTSTKLSANTPETGHGTGKWSIISGNDGIFDDSANTNTTFSGVLHESYLLRWSISTSCENSTDDVLIAFKQDSEGSPVTDIDGNTYKTAWIGDQLWMAENLKVSKEHNGTIIPLITDSIEWGNLNDDNIDKAYCYYNNDKANFDKYGALYTYAAAKVACPNGWHLPNNSDWDELVNYISDNGYEDYEGMALKSTTGWYDYGNGSDNFGFNAFPGGYRPYYTDAYHQIGLFGYWWSATEESANISYSRMLYYGKQKVYLADKNKSSGCSIRCIKDD